MGHVTTLLSVSRCLICLLADGWQLTKDYYKPVYVEADFPNPKIEEDLDQRLPLEEYELGEELGGIVTDIWLYHGVQVDFGAHYAGWVLRATRGGQVLGLCLIDMGNVAKLWVGGRRSCCGKGREAAGVYCSLWLCPHADPIASCLPIML